MQFKRDLKYRQKIYDNYIKIDRFSIHSVLAHKAPIYLAAVFSTIRDQLAKRFRAMCALRLFVLSASPIHLFYVRIQ